jgi:hypothetical protein
MVIFILHCLESITPPTLLEYLFHLLKIYTSDLDAFTNATEKNPSKANSGKAKRVFPFSLRNPKIQYRLKNSPLPTPILSQINPLRAL